MNYFCCRSFQIYDQNPSRILFRQSSFETDRYLFWNLPTIYHLFHPHPYCKIRGTMWVPEILKTDVPKTISQECKNITVLHNITHPLFVKSIWKHIWYCFSTIALLFAKCLYILITLSSPSHVLKMGTPCCFKYGTYIVGKFI